jgi:hypothetical protein
VSPKLTHPTGDAARLRHAGSTGPVFAPLRDPAYFAQVRLAEWGAPVWPNGVDIAPDALHDRTHGDASPPATDAGASIATKTN